MHFSLRYFVPLAGLIIVPGCAGPVASAAVSPPIAEAPQARPTGAPTAAPARLSASVLVGVARYFGAPLAGASLRVHALNQTDVVATGTTSSDGTFQLALPASVAPGTVVEIIASGLGHRVANLAAVPQRQLLSDDNIVLDEACTAALLVLGPRLIAALQLGTPAAQQAALTALQAAAAALGSASLDPTTFDKAVAAVLNAADQVVQNDGNRAVLAAAIPAAQVAALLQQADALADVIRQGVAAGSPMPDGLLLQALPIGPQVAVAVFTTANTTNTSLPPASTGGGGADGASSPVTGNAAENAGITLAIVSPLDGTYSSPTSGPVGSANPKK